MIDINVILFNIYNFSMHLLTKFIINKMIIQFINNYNKILFIVLIFMKNLFETLILYLSIML